MHSICPSSQHCKPKPTRHEPACDRQLQLEACLPLRSTLSELQEKLKLGQTSAKGLAKSYDENQLDVHCRQVAPTGQRYTTLKSLYDESPIAVYKRRRDTVHLGITIVEINPHRQC